MQNEKEKENSPKEGEYKSKQEMINELMKLRAQKIAELEKIAEDLRFLLQK